jgi:hypothetical protein
MPSSSFATLGSAAVAAERELRSTQAVGYASGLLILLNLTPLACVIKGEHRPEAENPWTHLYHY